MPYPLSASITAWGIAAAEFIAQLPVDAGFSVWPAPNVSLHAAVTNLLDARYLDRPEADAFPQPGRSVVIQLTVGG